jgi:ankyrin repeat protein
MNKKELDKIKYDLYYDGFMRNNHKKVYETLKQYPELIDADIEIPQEKGGKTNGDTPLLSSIAFSDVEMIKTLLEEFHTNPNIPDIDKGFTALFSLSNINKIEKKEIVDILLEKGADVNLASHKGKTPLMLAAQFGHLWMVKKLLDNGADATLMDKNKSNALYWMGYYWGEENEALIDEIIKLLVEHGADLYAINDFGYTPLSLAKEYDAPLVEKVLLKYMKLYPKNEELSTSLNNNTIPDDFMK